MAELSFTKPDEFYQARHRLPGVAITTMLNPMIQAVEITGEFHLALDHRRSVAREAVGQHGQAVIMQVVRDVEDDMLVALRHRIAEDRADDQAQIARLTRERDEYRALAKTLQAAVDRLAR